MCITTKRTFTIMSIFFVISILVSPGTINAQEQASAQHEILKHEIGTWNADATFFMPDGNQMKATGKETNRMLGEFWIISDFEMDMGGMPFQGHGSFGYDSKNGNYIGSWIDSMSPHVMHMTGTWDAEQRTFIYLAEGLDMMGSPEKSKMTTVLSADGKTRTFTRWVQTPGTEEWAKTMEVIYTKQAETASDN